MQNKLNFFDLIDKLFSYIIINLDLIISTVVFLMGLGIVFLSF